MSHEAERGESWEQVWRTPSEESIGLYPGLVVHDSRVSGSICVGPTRLPVWTLVATAIKQTWADVEHGWEPSEYGYDEDQFADFVYRLLEQRGEFGRLLLMLANAERLEADREEAWETANVVYEDGIGAPKPDAEPEPGPWWWHTDITAPLIEQLRRCTASLEAITACP